MPLLFNLRIKNVFPNRYPLASPDQGPEGIPAESENSIGLKGFDRTYGHAEYQIIVELLHCSNRDNDAGKEW